MFAWIFSQILSINHCYHRRHLHHHRNFMLPSLFISEYPSPTNMPYMPFCALKLSQLSFNVEKTIAAIILTSCDASCGNYKGMIISCYSPHKPYLYVSTGEQKKETNLIRMTLPNRFHVVNLNLGIDNQLMQADFLPPATLPKYILHTSN